MLGWWNTGILGTKVTNTKFTFLCVRKKNQPCKPNTTTPTNFTKVNTPEKVLLCWQKTGVLCHGLFMLSKKIAGYGYCWSCKTICFITFSNPNHFH